MASVPDVRISPEEYLKRERKAETRSEYVDGHVYAMAGASLAHSTICANLFTVVGQALAGGPCRTLTNDLRVRVPNSSLYTYPDLTMVCGKPETEDDGLDTLLNPIAIVEVLSPSTESWDRGRKFAYYRSIPTLKEYILVAQDKPVIERYVRAGDNWVLSVVEGLESTLQLESVNLQIPLAKAYERVEFPIDPDPKPTN